MEYCMVCECVCVFNLLRAAVNLEVISVSDWGGRQPKRELAKLNLPVQRVIISHTAAEGCESRVS